MRKRDAALILACLLSAGTMTAQAAEPRSHGDEAKAANLDVKTLEALDVAMQKQVDEKKVSGVIGLISRHGKIGYYEAFGQRVIEKTSR
jgi:hypothetical protein